MEQCVRIVARPVVDNPLEFPIYIDVVLDANGRALGGRPYFGFQGEIEFTSGVSMPFILHPNGRLDFGERYAEPSDRFFQTDLLDIHIRKDQMVTIHGDGDYKAFFRVAAVTPCI